MEREARNLGDFKRGFLNQLFAKAQTGVGAFSKDKNITRYLGVVAQELIPAARKLMEEKGPITESDIKRVEEGLGDTTTPLEDKLFLLDELRNKVRTALTNKKEVAGLNDEQFSGKYKALSNTLAGEEAKFNEPAASSGFRIISVEE
jgi:hypothetical protein